MRYTTSAPNAWRCLNKLSLEHQRISSTLQSFQKMLSQMEGKDDVSAEYGDDLRKFAQFISKFALFHHGKEGILYGKSLEVSESTSNRKAASAKMVTSVSDEHSDREGFARSIETIALGLADPSNKEFKVEDLLDAAETYLEEQYEHLTEEEQLIYPTIAKQLTVEQIEEVSQTMEKYEDENGADYAEMERISDELVAKYLRS
eukprot:325754_1